MNILGIDLAQRCGWSLLNVWEKPINTVLVPREGEVLLYPWLRRVEGEFWGNVDVAGALDLHHDGGIYGDNNLPNGDRMSEWLGRVCAEMHALDGVIAAAGVSMVICEMPDNFMMGYRVNKRGQMRKASSPRTIESMLRLSSQIFSVYAEWKRDRVVMQDCNLVCVSATQWQKLMFYNVPSAGVPDSVTVDGKSVKLEETKRMALAAAWYHLGLATRDPDIADASLLALWKYGQTVRANEKQLSLALGRGKRRDK